MMRLEDMALDAEISAFELAPSAEEALEQLEALRTRLKKECKEDLGENFDEGIFDWWFASQLLLRAMMRLGFGPPQATKH